jgi:hypothetical protein
MDGGRCGEKAVLHTDSAPGLTPGGASPAPTTGAGLRRG